MMYRYYEKIFCHHPTLSQKTGFSVAFGSTKAQTPWGAWEIYKIELSEMQFPAFPAQELGNWEGLLRS